MASMLSLLDVLPRHERLDIGSDQFLDVFGISGGDIGKILERYPNAFQQIHSSGSHPTRMDSGLMGALMAASMRDKDGESLLGNDMVEKSCRNMGAGDQMRVMQVLAKCTFPDGVGPFIEGLESMSSATFEAIELVVQVGSKARATDSRQTQKPLDAPVTPASGS